MFGMEIPMLYGFYFQRLKRMEFEGPKILLFDPDSYSLLRVIQTFRFFSTIHNIIIDRVAVCPLNST